MLRYVHFHYFKGKQNVERDIFKLFKEKGTLFIYITIELYNYNLFLEFQ